MNSLRFTIYTRESGRIVELLNTGMVGPSVFSSLRSSHSLHGNTHPSSGDTDSLEPAVDVAGVSRIPAGRIVLDFEEDVRQRQLFVRIFNPPHIQMHHTAMHVLETAFFLVACVLMFVFLYLLDEAPVRAGDRGG